MLLSKKVDGVVEQSSVLAKDFDITYDVVVAGLGVAGSIAAIVAARKGLKVLGIESFSCMGGIGTAGGIMEYYFGNEGGIYEEIDTDIQKYDGRIYASAGKINIEAKKYELENKALKAGAQIWYDSVICGVYLDEKTVVGVDVITDGGIKSVGCKVLIDSTGDAYVCEIAGCLWSWGREKDGRNQPFTSVEVYLREGGIGHTNMDSGIVDQSNIQELSRAIVFSHAEHIKNVQDDTRPFLYCAPQIGVRDGRRIEGEDKLTLTGFFEGEVTDKPVFYAYADLDKHGWDMIFDTDILQDWSLAANLSAVNITVPISMGSFIPKGYNGILAAGRSMSFDRDISSCVRMMRDMQKAGEVAANMAYIAIDDGVDMIDVSYQKLAAMLRETGCLSDANNKGYKFDHPSQKFDAGVDIGVEWLTDTQDIKRQLSTLKPGVALWSCRLLGAKVTDTLMCWLGDTDKNLRMHSAIALSLIGDSGGLPVLHEMISGRDATKLQDCRKNNRLRGYIAIYLAGRLGDTAIVDELIDIIASPQEIHRPIYNDPGLVGTHYTIDGYNDVYFQFFSHSIMALVRIGDKNVGLRNKIKDAISSAIDDDTYKRRITTRGSNTAEYSIVVNLKDVIAQEIAKW